VDSVGGSDSNPGTLAAPWKTVAKVDAISLSPGQSVGFKAGGTWREILTPSTTGGTSGNPITFTSYGTGALPSLTAFAMWSGGFVTVNGLRFTGNTSSGYPTESSGIQLRNVNNLTFTDCQIDTNASSGIGIGSGSYNILISGGSIFGNGTNASTDGGGIGIGNDGAASHDIVIQGVHIYANDVASSFGGNITVAPTSTNQLPYNILITDCVLENDQQVGLQVLGGVVTATYNIISGNTYFGIDIDAIQPTTFNAYNNTIYNNGTFAISVYPTGSGTGTVTFENNLLSMNDSSAAWDDVGWFSPAVSFTSDYNIVYNTMASSPRWYNSSTYYLSLALWRDHSSQDAHSMASNPLLTSPASGDFTLQPGSPAIGRGLYIPGVSASNPPNIGAK
jgi:hypothetical protein